MIGIYIKNRIKSELPATFTSPFSRDKYHSFTVPSSETDTRV